MSSLFLQTLGIVLHLGMVYGLVRFFVLPACRR
jgi:hypothetical protein